MQASETHRDQAEREIVVMRVVAAPRELVWKVWTEPEHVAQWWGPDGFTSTIPEMEVRPEGVWRVVLHGPDGTDYPNRIVFEEVVKPESLVYAHSGEGDFADHKFHVTVTFAEHPDGTEVTFRAVFPTAAERDEVSAGFGSGAMQMLGRLDAYLAGVL